MGLSRMRLLPWCLTLAMVTALPASGQVIVGRLVDAQTRLGVAGAAIQLLDRNSEPRAVSVSDSVGSFVVFTEVPGRYTLRAERLGYASVRTGQFDLIIADTLDVEVVISVEPIVLERLVVRSQREALVLDSRLERRGYYEREAKYGLSGSGYGIFLDRAAIQAANAFRLSDLFRDMPRMRLVYAGGRRVEIHTMKGCVPTFYIDGTRYQLRRDETIDEVIHPAAIAAVEVYPGNVQPAK